MYHWEFLGEEGFDACAVLKRYGIQREQVLTRLPDGSDEQGPPTLDIGLELFCALVGLSAGV
jgi:hypothetical protein